MPPRRHEQAESQQEKPKEFENLAGVAIDDEGDDTLRSSIVSGRPTEASTAVCSRPLCSCLSIVSSRENPGEATLGGEEPDVVLPPPAELPRYQPSLSEVSERGVRPQMRVGMVLPRGTVPVLPFPPL